MIALITDQHLDGRKGSVAFWEYFKKFYDDVFFPTLEKKGIKNIIDLGDTFDNRKSIDFNVWSRVRQYYFQRVVQVNARMNGKQRSMECLHTTCSKGLEVKRGLKILCILKTLHHMQQSG